MFNYKIISNISLRYLLYKYKQKIISIPECWKEILKILHTIFVVKNFVIKKKECIILIKILKCIVKENVNVKVIQIICIQLIKFILENIILLFLKCWNKEPKNNSNINTIVTFLFVLKHLKKLLFPLKQFLFRRRIVPCSDRETRNR